MAITLDAIDSACPFHRTGVVVLPRVAGQEKSDMGNLRGQVALITGGARGIGAAIARKLADKGAGVAIMDCRLGDDAAALLAYARRQGVWAAAIEGDVSVPSDVDRAVTAVGDSQGRIDILVNDAGICPFSDFFSITDEIWRRTLDVNLSGMFYTTRAVARIMKSQERGSIVNVSTVSTHLVTPHQVHYIASKGGVEALTRALALALSPYGVRVNAIAPSGARTEINANVEEQRQAWDKTGVQRIRRPIPLKREGVPEDYANAVAYLVSEEAAYVTGICLPVDGGVSLV